MYSVGQLVRLVKPVQQDEILFPIGTEGQVIYSSDLSGKTMYLIELLGAWFRWSLNEGYIPSHKKDPQALQETLGNVFIDETCIESLKQSVEPESIQPIAYGYIP